MEKFIDELSEGFDELPSETKSAYVQMTPAERFTLGMKLNNKILDFILSGEWRHEQGRKKKDGENKHKRKRDGKIQT